MGDVYAQIGPSRTILHEEVEDRRGIDFSEINGTCGIRHVFPSKCYADSAFGRFGGGVLEGARQFAEVLGRFREGYGPGPCRSLVGILPSFLVSH